MMNRRVSADHGKGWSPARGSWLPALLAATSITAPSVAGQPLTAIDQAVFRSHTELVTLYATVRGRDGRLLTDLSRDDFSVIDDGVRVPVTLFSSDPQPITAVVMADMSTSIRDVPRIHGALRHFVHSLRVGDRLRIGTFGTEISLSYYLTDDVVLLERVLAEELANRPWGSTPLWRAIDTAVRSLEGEPSRHVVVVLTDGSDYSPSTDRGLPPLPGGASGLRKRIESRPDLLLYAIGSGDLRVRQRLQGDIIKLVRASGGGHVDLAPHDDLGRILDGVGEELRRQYVIGFEPRHRDGLIHPVRVRVSRSGATLRTRESYEAPVRQSPVPSRPQEFR